jgi:hypothetical protein
MANYSQHSGPIRRYLRKELLHFTDGTVAEHTSKEVEHLAFPEHEPPIVSNLGVWVVPASDYYLQSWKDINPAIRNVTFLYKGL